MNTHPRNKLIVGLALGLFAWTAVLVPSNANAAPDAYATILGETQGYIKGDVTQAGREETILIKAFGSSVSAEYDAGTGLPSAVKQHRPVRLLKEVDRASPRLLAAFKNNETLIEVTVQFWRLTAAGPEQHIATVELINAHVVSILPGHSSQEDDSRTPFRETIGLTYESMTVTWELTNDSEQIDW